MTTNLIILEEVVVKKTPQARSRKFYLCKCVCGVEKLIDKYSVESGRSTNCGCLRTKTLKEANITHGNTKHPLYGVWLNIKQRCGNPNLKGYKNYGGRGITLSKEWHDFNQFFQDNIEKYKKGLTIERIDVDRNYEKGNVDWIPRSKQKLNTRDTVYITINGQKHKLHEYCLVHNLPKVRIRLRLLRGWKPEDAITIKQYSKKPQ